MEGFEGAMESSVWRPHGPGRAGASAEMEADEARLLRAAALRLVGGLDAGRLDLLAKGLVRWLLAHGTTIGLDIKSLRALRPDEEVRPADLPAMLAAFREPPGQPSGASALDQRLDWLAGALGLDALDRALIGLYARVSLFEPWRELLEALGLPRQLEPRTAAALVGAHPDEVEARLEPGMPLFRFGLIATDHDGDRRVNSFLRRIARMATTEPEALTRRMLPPAPPSTLEWRDFDHLAPLRDAAAAAVAEAARLGRGLNVLLHGPPGTGKSEFARALADQAGLTAVFAGLAEDDGGEPARYERLAHLSVLRALTRADRRHLIVVDEADDVLTLSEPDRQNRSKLWLNRLVEEAEAPTVWIVNDPDLLGPAIVRRMTLAIGFDLPPPSVRARVVERAAAAAGLALDAEAVRAAAAVPASPAVLANAVDAAALAGGDPALVREVALALNRALGARDPVRLRPSPLYDPALAHADRDLPDLAGRLAASADRGWSLLLSGPSGTGKSAYARHLAKRLGVEVDERRGSDLLSPFVGCTEANIAAAFRDAARAGAMLLIDEADSFLFSRARAERSWEAGMVNEMLRAMEGHPAPFVATTNLADVLDPAAQRRFTLHVRFRPLTPSRAAELFARTFAARLSAGVEPLEGLTPGDFAVVAKRAELLDARDPAALVRELRGEAEARGHCGGVAGFHPPALRWREEA